MKGDMRSGGSNVAKALKGRGQEEEVGFFFTGAYERPPLNGSKKGARNVPNGGARMSYRKKGALLVPHSVSDNTKKGDGPGRKKKKKKYV